MHKMGYGDIGERQWPSKFFDGYCADIITCMQDIHIYFSCYFTFQAYMRAFYHAGYSGVLYLDWRILNDIKTVSIVGVTETYSISP